MTKRFTCEINPALDIRLSVWAAHLQTTKADAGARAMAQGIPDWVMAVPPSEARRMATSGNDATNAEEQAANDDYLAQAFDEES